MCLWHSYAALIALSHADIFHLKYDTILIHIIFNYFVISKCIVTAYIDLFY